MTITLKKMVTQAKAALIELVGPQFLAADGTNFLIKNSFCITDIETAVSEMIF